MSYLTVRWQNFRGFEDTGPLELRPLTVLIGPNNAGKTSLFAPLLILKQTWESEDPNLCLKSRGGIFDAGSYVDFITNHDTSLPLKLELCWSAAPTKGQKRGKPQPLGSLPPATLALEFAYDKKSDKIKLAKYLVRDKLGRAMLRRELLESGKYSIHGIKLPKSTDDIESRESNKAIRQGVPTHFLFNANRVMQSLIRASDTKKVRKGKNRTDTKTIKIPTGTMEYVSITNFVERALEDIFESLSYIGPLRERPLRLYELSDETPTAVGIRGQDAPELLFRSTDGSFDNDVNCWIRKFGFGSKLACDKLLPDAFTVNLIRKNRSKVNFADTGFGISQIFPIIVSGLWSKKNRRIVFEQPEIHLNPKLQSLLADLFVAFVNSSQQVIIETHSEHLLLRLRRLVAEGKISSDQIALYFVESDSGKAVIRHIPVESNGHIEPLNWPKDFFQDALRESIGLASAQVKDL